MKRTLFILFFVVFSFYSYSQNILKGRVIDESGNPIELTTVVLLNPTDSTLKHFGVTNKDGYYQIKAVKNDSYLLLLGMHDQYSHRKYQPRPLKYLPLLLHHHHQNARNWHHCHKPV